MEESSWLSVSTVANSILMELDFADFAEINNLAKPSYKGCEWKHNKFKT
ncbi:MAG: hypothetical protein VW270_17120 [Candidatus Poseidoniales archaeon]